MEQPLDNSPSYEQLASECCAMARTIESIRTALVELGTTPNRAMDAIALCKRLFDFVNSNGELNVSESSYWYCELEKIAQQHQ